MHRLLQVFAARVRLALRVPLETETEQRNYRYAVIEGALATITVQIVATFTPVFAISLGATNQQVGFIYSFPFLFNIAALLISAGSTRRRERHLPVGQVTAVLHRVLILLLLLAPVLGRFGVWWLLVLYSLASAAMAVSSVFWQAIVSDMFPPGRRGVVFGTRSMYTGIADSPVLWFQAGCWTWSPTPQLRIRLRLGSARRLPRGVLLRQARASRADELPLGDGARPPARICERSSAPRRAGASCVDLFRGRVQLGLSHGVAPRDDLFRRTSRLQQRHDRTVDRNLGPLQVIGGGVWGFWPTGGA